MPESLQWASYYNIHRLDLWLESSLALKAPVSEEKEEKQKFPLDAFFQQIVCVTEKLDGSNLAIHAMKRSTRKSGKNREKGSEAKAEQEWEIVELRGRNSSLWKSLDNKSLTNITYGKVGKLDNLPYAALEFASKIGEMLGVPEIVLYGEAFRAPAQRLASWHPFAYKLPQSDWKLRTLTSEVHALFQKASGVGPFSGHEDTLKFLQEEKKKKPGFPTGTLLHRSDFCGH
eukprot:gb/GEZN01016923.1/.p1 GENE.gb/GEZN01016923.1/~~gb/GEZN01016923.1/.p1  ORF type:complete len:257 (-),score=34.79 gb/GEZN01016923.1/:50-739(-)